jgi:hypothetical protein
MHPTVEWHPRQGRGSFSELFHDQFQRLSRGEQLATVIRTIIDSGEAHNRSVELAAEAWAYLREHELWRADPQQRYASSAELQSQLNEDIGLHTILARFNKISRDRLAFAAAIERRWGKKVDECLPAPLNPPSMSVLLLKSLRRLSARTGACDAARLLTRAVASRQQRARTSKVDHVTVVDVLWALEQLAAITPSPCHPELATLVESDTTKDPSTEVTQSAHCDTTPLSPVPNGDDPTLPHLAATPTSYPGSTRKIRRKNKRASAKARRCKCPPALLRQFSKQATGGPGDPAAQSMLQAAMAGGVHSLCHRHCRLLAAALGMRNNHKAEELNARLQAVASQDDGDPVEILAQHPKWMRQKHREPSEQDRLMIYRYPHASTASFTFNAAQIMDRFAGDGARLEWEARGTLILNQFFAYLNSPEVRKQIDEEFALYRHHEQVPSGKKRMGWMRHMFYSLIQQLVRMDPAWYALTAAARPDHQWRLISYPYVTKDTDPGERTGFLHLDLNVGRFVADGSGGNLLSSSVALDDETPNGCTVVVPGFHRHIHEWYDRTRARDDTAGGATTNCAARYRAEDRQSWGNPEPQPCVALGIRLTLPTLMHGSTPQADRRRRSLFAWYSAIAEDHETLQDAPTLTWSQVAICHRDRLIPTREPAGCAPLHGVPGWAFPGSILLDRVSPLAEALVGSRRWTDPDVLRERDILLGSDDDASHALVAVIRARLVEAYLRQWKDLVAAEKRAYGVNSYFGRRDGDITSNQGSSHADI